MQRDEERENEKGFRVVDRRRFTAEGEARTDVEERAERPAEPKLEPPRREEPRLAPEEPRRADPRQAAPAAAPAEPEDGIDFMGFAQSLAINALAAMGALPEAQAQGLPENPELAREYVDILAMLQRKTRGNLSRQEEAALTQLIGDLKTQYMRSQGPSTGRRR